MINILVALNAEAKPIRQALNLKSVQDSAPWRCFENEQYRLIVTGTGALNMAMATSWLYGAYGAASLWLNVGTVGHRSAEPGSIVIANRVQDCRSGQTWFIPILANGLATATICSVECTQTQFSDLNYYDMEAAGFVQAAIRATERERIHSIKIVSDNEIERSEDLDEIKLIGIVEDATQAVLTTVNRISNSLRLDSSGNTKILKPKSNDEDFDLGDLRRVSSAQEHRWRELKRRWSAVGRSVKGLRQSLELHKSTTSFLDWMEIQLLSKPISLQRKL